MRQPTDDHRTCQWELIRYVRVQRPIHGHTQIVRAQQANGYTHTLLLLLQQPSSAGGSTVACISNAQVVPTPPIVNNSCGDPWTGPGYRGRSCVRNKTYTWTYTDCTGATSQWVYTYTITPPTFTLPANGGSTVVCISNAQTVPTPPTVNNSCGAP